MPVTQMKALWSLDKDLTDISAMGCNVRFFFSSYIIFKYVFKKIWCAFKKEQFNLKSVSVKFRKRVQLNYVSLKGMTNLRFSVGKAVREMLVQRAPTCPGEVAEATGLHGKFIYNIDAMYKAASQDFAFCLFEPAPFQCCVYHTGSSTPSTSLSVVSYQSPCLASPSLLGCNDCRMLVLATGRFQYLEVGTQRGIPVITVQ